MEEARALSLQEKLFYKVKMGSNRALFKNKPIDKQKIIWHVKDNTLKSVPLLKRVCLEYAIKCIGDKIDHNFLIIQV